MPGPVKRRSKRACDLCFAKRIKCDQREPECSNCKLYHRECRRSVNRSKNDPPTARRSVTVTEFRSDGGQLPPINVNSGVDINPPRSFDFREALPEYNHLSTASQCPASPSPWTYNIVSPTLYHGSSDPSLWLPPIDELVPIIDHYFHAISPSLPLFSQPLFMRTLTTFLSPSSTSPCDRTTWSSILVVTALSLQSDYPAHIPPAKRKVWIDYCMRNAQSVLPELMARHEDLLGLQVILGLTMLFRSAVNLRPASMLASIAVRLAYQMQLYRKDTMQYFSEEEALQRVDVFWVTYVLDMDISLKLKSPSTLSQTCIDIPKPISPSGVIHTKSRNAHLNIFHKRVALAEIEAQIFTLLYSPGSSPFTPPGRQSAIESVESLLAEWYASIPHSFKPENAPACLDAEDLTQVANMFHVYLFCQIGTRDLWNDEMEWARRVSSLSRAAMRDIMVALQGSKVTPCMQKQHKPGTDCWAKCVTACREVTTLFHATQKTSHLTLQGVCALSTAEIVLLSNILLDPTQDPDTTAHDFQLVANSRKVFNQLFTGHHSVVHDSLNTILDDLYKLATRSVSLWNAQSKFVPAIGGKPVASLDPVLLEFDDVLLGFENQGQGFDFDFDFSEATAPGITVDNSVFDPRWMTS